MPAGVRERLGSDAAFELAEYLGREQDEWSEDVLSAAADRFECRLAGEMSGLRRELQAGLGGVRQEVATSRVEMLKWSFIFWIGQVAAIAGLLTMMLRARP
jgi:hypothetical protein